MYKLKKNWEGNLPVNLLGLGPRLIKKRIYRAAVSQRLRITALYCAHGHSDNNPLIVSQSAIYLYPVSDIILC